MPAKLFWRKVFTLAIVVILLMGSVSIARAVEEFNIDHNRDSDLLPYNVSEISSNKFSDMAHPVGNHIQVYRPRTADYDSIYVIRVENGYFMSGKPASFFITEATTNTVVDQDPIYATIFDFTFYHDTETGQKELLAFGLRHDSAFVFRDRLSEEQIDPLFLATGEDISGDGIWRGVNYPCLVADYDFDGIEEVFAQVCPGRDLKPRILFCIDPVNLRIEWSLPVAGAITEGSIFDCRDSTDPAVILATYNFKNGTEDAEFSDSFCYLVKIDNQGRIKHKSVLSLEHGVKGIWRASSEDNYFVYHGLPMIPEDSVHENIEHHYQISKIDRDCNVLSRYNIPGRLRSIWYGDYDHDNNTDIYTLFNDGIVRIYDQAFSLTAESNRTDLESFLDSVYLPGQQYSSYVFKTSQGMEFYSDRLEKQASIPGNYFRIHTLAYDDLNKGYIFTVSTDNFDRIVLLSQKSIGDFISLIFWKYEKFILILLSLLVVGLIILNAIRKRTARELSIRDRQLQSVFKNAQDVFYRTSLDGTIQWVSYSAGRMFGFDDLEKVIGRPVTDFYADPGDRETLLNRLRAEGELNDYEIEMRTANRGNIIVSVNAYLIRDNKGIANKIEGIIRDVTDRRKAEQAFRESEVLYRTLVESAGEAIFMVDEEGIFLFLNGVAGKRLGGDPTNLIGKKMKDLFPPDIADRQLSSVRKVIETKTGSIFETHTKLKGRELRYRTSLQPVFEEDGSVRRVLGIARDITPLHETRERLELEKAFSHSLLNTSNSLIVCLDKDCRIKVFNQELERVTGYKSEEVLGKNWEDIFVPDRYLTRTELFEEWVGKHPADMYEREIIIKSGEERTILWSNSVVYYPETSDFTAVAIGQDITERKNIQLEAERAHNELKQVYDAAAPMCVIDKNYNIVRVNATYCRLFKTTPEEEIGKKCYEKWPGKLCRTRKCPLVKVLNGADYYEYDWETNLDDGTYISTLVTAVPYLNPDGKLMGIVETFTDITKRKLAEEALRQSQNRFNQALHNSQDIMYRLNFQTGETEYVSRVIEQMTGYKVSEVIDILNNNELGMYYFIHEDDAANYRETLSPKRLADPAIKDGKLEYRFRCKDGSYIYLSDTFSIVRDNEGGLKHMIGSARDVTAERQAQEILRANEQFNRAVIEKSPLGVSVRNRHGALLSCNEAWKKIWAADDNAVEEDMSRERTELQFDRRDGYLDKWQEQVREIYRSGGYLHVPEVECRKHRSGKNHWVSQHFYAILNDAGEVDRVVILTEDVTERVMYEKRLKESEQRFRDIAHALPVPSVISGYPDGKVLYYNKGFREAIGYTDEEIEGADVTGFFRDREGAQELIDRIYKERRIEGIEVEGRRKNGSAFWAVLTLQMIRFNDRDAIFGGFVDVTHMKETQQALKESEQRFKAIAKAMPIPIGITSWPEGEVLFLNDLLPPAFGYTPEEFKSLKANDLYADPGQRIEMAKAIEELGYIENFEAEGIKKDNTRFWALMTLRRIQFAGQNAVIGGIVDITERKKTEVALAESERKFRNLAEHSVQAIFVVQNNRIVFANRRMAEIGELQLDDILKQSPEELLKMICDTASRREFYRDYLRRCHNTAPLQHYELKIETTRGRTHWIEVIIGNITYDGSPAVMGTLIDISERVRAVERMRAADQYKYDMAKRTAGVFAHEIRNALYPASMVLPKLQTNGKQNGLGEAKVSEFAEIAERAIKRAGKMTRQISKYVKLESEYFPQSVRLAEVFAEVMTHNQYVIDEKSVHIEIDGKTGVKVRSNKNQLSMVFNNLLMNALDALTERPSPDILISWEEKNGMVSLIFEDNGTGIEEKSIDKIFEPFFTTRTKRGGTGIGLAMVKRIMEMYGGSILVENLNGKGTRFDLTFVSVSLKTPQQNS